MIFAENADEPVNESGKRRRRVWVPTKLSHIFREPEDEMECDADAAWHWDCRNWTQIRP
jgi:hypothetical protein